jgi:hypothetical protein
MNERYIVAREAPTRDLIDLARQAALVLADRLHDPVATLLSSALLDACTEVATDVAEPVLA